MPRRIPALPQVLLSILLFAALSFGAEVTSGVETHAALAIGMVTGLAFGALVGLWRLVRG